MLAPITIIFFGQNVWAAIFSAVEPGLSYRRAWYHSMVTMTTVGYGDVSLTVRFPPPVPAPHVEFVAQRVLRRVMRAA